MFCLGLPILKVFWLCGRDHHIGIAKAEQKLSFIGQKLQDHQNSTTVIQGTWHKISDLPAQTSLKPDHHKHAQILTLQSILLQHLGFHLIHQ